MVFSEQIAELAQQADSAARDADDETRAQILAARFRAALLQIAPDDLPQSQFLCIMAAVLGRFARDMTEGDPEVLAEALCAMVLRHARSFE